MSYEVKFNTRATRQVRKLDPHIKRVVKERLRGEGIVNVQEVASLS